MQTPETTKTSLRDILLVVFKRKGVILLFFSATFCIVTIGTLVAQPTYEATSQILVKIGRENIYVPPIAKANKFVNQYIVRLLLFRGINFGFTYEVHDASEDD